MPSVEYPEDIHDPADAAELAEYDRVQQETMNKLLGLQEEARKLMGDGLHQWDPAWSPATEAVPAEPVSNPQRLRLSDLKSVDTLPYFAYLAEHVRAETACDAVISASLDVLTAERSDVAISDFSASLARADDQLALAARELVQAVDALPADEQPPGWV